MYVQQAVLDMQSVKQVVQEVYNVCIAGSTGCKECRSGSTGG